MSKLGELKAKRDEIQAEIDRLEAKPVRKFYKGQIILRKDHDGDYCDASILLDYNPMTARPFVDADGIGWRYAEPCPDAINQWLPWHGGEERPCYGPVVVGFRCGSTGYLSKPAKFRWSHDGCSDDIVAYMPITTPEWFEVDE